MNSEVGTGSVDFTYIKSEGCFEVGTRDADFEIVKVATRSADFKQAACFQVEVGTLDADFRTVKVSIRSADFLFFLYDLFWKSASGLPTSAQWKSVIQMPTSFQLCTVIFLRDFVIN